MRYTSAGESHGTKIVVIVDDVPSGISVTNDDIAFELNRRSKSPGRSQRQEHETNSFKIVSGVVDGKTTANPVCIEINNDVCDDVSIDDDYFPRPGHADLNGVIKRNFDNSKNVSERASARETVARICAGVIAKNMLADLKVEVYSWVEAIGSIDISNSNNINQINLPQQSDIEISKLMCPDVEATKKMLEQIERATNAGDTLGGKIKLTACGLVPGIGGYAQPYDRIDSKISSAILSVPSIKGIEIGSAIYSSKNVGSASLDEIYVDDADGSLIRKTNYSGGIEGGMTNGMPIVITAYVKPVPTVHRNVKTIDLNNMKQIERSSNKRGDICIVPSAAVVCESELAILLANEYQDKFGHDAMSEIKYAYSAYKQRIRALK